MKLLLAFVLLVTTNAFAVDLCSFEETWQFNEALSPVHVSDDHKAFNDHEKRLIHTIIGEQRWWAGADLEESLYIFRGGEIKYFNLKNQKLVLVHFWPGDNEYGAFFTHVNGQYYLVAKIEDGSIICK